MGLGEKLTRLRKENNYTQEQLADILDVSRQSVSKWELDLAYPETDKLIKLGELYDCSMDYLLKDSDPPPQNSPITSERTAPTAQPTPFMNFLTSFTFERKSKTMVGGLPLWHINIGLGRTAKGIFAIGLSARGIFSLGLLSIGLFSMGVLSIGALTFGVLALGLIALGSISVGMLAFGAVAVGLLAVGAVAVGEFAVGAAAFGNYFAIGDYAHAAIAIGKTTAVGSTFSAPEITQANREEIIECLNNITPAFFVPLKNLIVSFFPFVN